MEPLKTLVFAGLRKDKGTFIGLGLLLFLAALALTLTASLFVDLSEREETLLDEVKAGDVFASDLAQSLTDEDVNEIGSLPDVEKVQVTEGFAAPTRVEDIHGNEIVEVSPPSANAYEAWGSSLEFNVFSDDLSSYRDNQDAPAEDEVYVRVAERALHNLQVGDYLLIDIGDKEVRLRIAGFYEDPQLGTPFMETKRYLLSPATFECLLARVEETDATGAGVASGAMSMEKEAYPIREINVTLTPEARAKGVDGQVLAERIAKETSWGASEHVIFSRQTLSGYGLLVVQVITAVLAVFALLLFVVALILCLHMASSSIQSGFADWGALKGAGLPRKMLRQALVVQYSLSAFMGLAFGFIGGCLLEPFFWPVFLLVTGVRAVSASFPWLAISSCAALLVALVACIAVKARSIGRITPLEALRQGDGDVRFSPRGASEISGNYLNASLAWRAIVSEKGRYAGIGVCSLLLCAFVALCFGIGGAVTGEDAVYKAFGVWKSDGSVRFDEQNVSFDEVRDTIEDVSPIALEWEEGAVMLNLDGEARTFVGLSDMDVLDESFIASGRAPKHANEALVGLSLARSMGLSVGDELRVLKSDGSERDFIVSGLLSSVLNGGTGVVLTYDGFRDLVGSESNAAGISIQYKLSDPSKADDVVAALADRFGDSVDTELTGLFGSSTGMLLLIRDMLTTLGYAMSALALALACIAVMLISRRTLLSERRDLGIYLAMGFTVRSLRASFTLRFLIVSAAGALIGAAITMATGGALISALFSLFGVGAFELVLPPWEAMGISMAFAFVFALSAYVFSRGIKDVSVQELVLE
ncbi:ABC transporter permease [Adlercreutzia agrestimuris]|uniref:ABC transporter permease n=1 Tax=Adlercreutzia agrestimuris TaxID=2941324 RepID=UPI00203D598B|nr:FtsX-like permease family protein [Adlercreutzia agrestimuris]